MLNKKSQHFANLTMLLASALVVLMPLFSQLVHYDQSQQNSLDAIFMPNCSAMANHTSLVEHQKDNPINSNKSTSHQHHLLEACGYCHLMFDKPLLKFTIAPLLLLASLSDFIVLPKAKTVIFAPVFSVQIRAPPDGC